MMRAALIHNTRCRFLYKLDVIAPDRAMAYVSLGHDDDPSGGYRGTSHDNKLSWGVIVSTTSKPVASLQKLSQVPFSLLG